MLTPTADFFCVRRRTVSPIRQKIALLISNTNFNHTRSLLGFTDFDIDRPIFDPATIGRGSASRQLATTEVQHGDGVSRTMGG
jgi:hypothetical protein